MLIRPVHIAFVGAGAVGCFYASRLHHVCRYSPVHYLYASHMRVFLSVPM